MTQRTIEHPSLSPFPHPRHPVVAIRALQIFLVAPFQIKTEQHLDLAGVIRIPELVDFLLETHALPIEVSHNWMLLLSFLHRDRDIAAPTPGVAIEGAVDHLGIFRGVSSTRLQGVRRRVKARKAFPPFYKILKILL